MIPVKPPTRESGNESFAQNISAIPVEGNKTKDTELSPPLHDDPVEMFQESARNAEELEFSLAGIEQELENDLITMKKEWDMNAREQAIHAFDMVKMVADGRVSAAVADDYVRKAGIKDHANATIPCSRIIRAFIANARRRGAPHTKQSDARASVIASAIDFAIRQGWSQVKFEADLRQERRKGKKHGIEFLAAEGRRMRGTTRRPSVQPELKKALIALQGDDDQYVALLFQRSGNKLTLIEKYGPYRNRPIITERNSGNEDKA
ncbi:MAG: hypothetical protein ACLPL5_08220 [Stellaceae bacterium]